jgi:alkylation response protein AidB-like acyl-CoA dehydrogenase
MNFLLSEQQLEIQRTVVRLLTERYDANAVHKVFDSATGFDENLWRDLADMGLTGLHLPEAYGGSQLELIDLAIVAEALGAAAAPVPLFGHWLAGLAINLAGDEEQKARWLPKLASGEVIATVAWAEGDGCWQPEEWDLEGGTHLTGRKAFVEGLPMAGLIVVGTRQGGLMLVASDAPGIAVQSVDSVDRTRRVSSITFNNTPAELLINGHAQSARLRDAALALLAADAFGGASRCVAMSMEYAKVREQYGAPIGQFQGLKHQLVNTAVEIEPARGLFWFAAHAFDHLPDEAPSACALAKAHLGERYMQAARDCIEAHGGIGYTWEYPAQIYFKRAMFDYTYLGRPAQHRARYAEMVYG